MSELVMMPQKDYKDICDAVRAKTGGTDLLKSGDLKAQIESIQSGGGSTASVPWNDVTFIDYDGTVLHSYTLEEAQALTELPPLPEQKGLICQGWNWSLEDIKAQNGPVIVGAMYITDDGKTRIYITLHEGRTSPMLGVCPKGTVTVDWGDGTEPDVLTGTSTSTVVWTPTHEYANPGDYVISLSVEGEMGLYSSSYSNHYPAILGHTSQSDGRNKVYQNAVKKIEIGNDVTIGRYAFQNCYSLESITIPNSVKSFDYNVFYNCYSLTSVTIPNGFTATGYGIFDSNYPLKSVSIPKGVKAIHQCAFDSCYSLEHVCIPNSVTKISSYAFKQSYGVRCYDFSHCTSIPDLEETSAFDGISADCQMLIPSALFDEWSAATNWTAYASYMVAV